MRSSFLNPIFGSGPAKTQAVTTQPEIINFLESTTPEAKAAWIAFKDLALRTIDNYIVLNRGGKLSGSGDEGLQRAINLKIEIEAIASNLSSEDTVKQLQAQRQLLLWLDASIRFSNSPNLRKMLLGSLGLTMDNFALLFLYGEPDYLSARTKAFELKLLRATTERSQTINWGQLQTQLIAMVTDYQSKELGGAEGKLRAMKLKRELESIVISEPATPEQQKKLTLLVGCILSSHCSSSDLKNHISSVIAQYISGVENISPNEFLADLKLEQRITPEALLEKELQLRTSKKSDAIALTLDQLKDRILKMQETTIQFIDIKIKNKQEGSIGGIRALRFLNILEKIETEANTDGADALDTQRKLFELVYLLTIHPPKSTQLKDRILAVLGVDEFTFHDILFSRNKESDFGDISRLSSDDAKCVLEEKKALSSNDHAVSFTTDISEKIKIAICKYQKRKSPGELGRARARNLLAAVTESSLPGKELVTLVNAIVFYSGSTELKKEILIQLKTNENNLRTLQQTHGISDYTLWKKARELNMLTVAPDWSAFQKQMQRAAKAYRRAHLGGFDGNYRAAVFLNSLNNINSLDHRAQYCLVLLACIIVKSSSTLFRNTLLDYISQNGIDEKGLENLKKHYGISSAELESQRLALEGDCYYQPPTVDAETLAKQLYSARSFCLRTSINQSEHILACRMKQQLETIMGNESLSAEQKLFLLHHLMKKVFHFSEKNSLTELTNEILVNTFWNDISIFPKSYVKSSNDENRTTKHNEKTIADEISKTITQEEVTQIEPTVKAELLRDLKIEDKFKEHLALAVTRYLNSNKGGPEGRLRARNLKNVLGAVMSSPLTENDKEMLALLVCTVVLHSTSDQLRKKILCCLGLSAFQISAMQHQYKIENETCIALEKRLLNAEVALITTTAEVNQIQNERLPCPFLKNNNWNDFLDKLRTCIPVKIYENIGTSASFGFQPLLAELKKLNTPLTHKDTYQLILIVCTLTLFSKNASLTQLKKLILSLHEENKNNTHDEKVRDIIKQLRKEANILPTEMEKLLDVFANPQSVEMTELSRPEQREQTI